MLVRDPVVSPEAVLAGVGPRGRGRGRPGWRRRSEAAALDATARAVVDELESTYPDVLLLDADPRARGAVHRAARLRRPGATG